MANSAAFHLLSMFLCEGTSPGGRENFMDTIFRVQQLATGRNTWTTAGDELRQLRAKFIDGQMTTSERIALSKLLAVEPDGPLSGRLMVLIMTTLKKSIDERDERGMPVAYNADGYNPRYTAGDEDLPDNYYDLIPPLDFGLSGKEGHDAAFERLAEMFLHRDMSLMEDREAFIKFLGHDHNLPDMNLSKFSLRYVDIHNSVANEYLYRLVMAFIHGEYTQHEWTGLARYLGYDPVDVESIHNIRQTHRIIGAVQHSREFAEFLNRMKEKYGDSSTL